MTGFGSEGQQNSYRSGTNEINRYCMQSSAMANTKEEEHWSSFRSAVAYLQHKLSKVAPRSKENVESSGMTNDGPHRRNSISIYRKFDSSHDEHLSAFNTDACNECASPQLRPQDITSNNNHWDDTNSIDAHLVHRRLELIGLEKVHNNISWNGNAIDILDTGYLESPAHGGGAPSHASYATNALSITEQQLAETRLRLAMTESERDELEFQLIQGS